MAVPSAIPAPLHGELARLLPLLPVLDAVGQTRHVTAAAELLGVPQPTVSRALARAAVVVGAELVRKEGRGIRLTPAAEQLLPAVRTALEELQHGLDALHEREHQARGVVRLSFQMTFGESAVPVFVSGFRAEYPEVRFELIQGSRQSCLDALAEGRVDLSIVSPRPVPTRDVDSATLHVQPVRLAVPAGHRLAHRGAVRLAEVSGEPFVALERGFGMRSILDRLGRDAGFTPDIAFSGQDSRTLLGLVSAGLGVALVPPSSAGHGAVYGSTLQSTGLGWAELALEDDGAFREIGLVWPKIVGEPPQVRMFREHILALDAGLLADAFGR
ncbi:LysR substrate-binding domain-containing protein [Sinomonas sp. ASV486]|uniref:LysR substrate-binding domain-containing protein n=1 Tax=Sinomonas sp. ASV486 TaxID=3051170 RepID=UPI0027DB564D|nr:LysR substrate-binding domain-containing protein [Sinomonas sp. ASV486]MDQ4491148.1 LysR substrate-binding domain-containing protein [Sinomonas sp. ASV486]